jgi:hypothetical protein
MANTGNSIKNDPIREIAGGDITDTFQPIQLSGNAFLRNAFRVTITNWTNGDVYLSTDGETDQMKMPALSARILDDKTNDMFRRQGTEYSVRYDMTPGVPTGWLTLEVEYV